MLCEVRWSAFFARSHKSVMVTGSVTGIGFYGATRFWPLLLIAFVPWIVYLVPYLFGLYAPR